jgi:hypothetical protein
MSTTYHTDTAVDGHAAVAADVTVPDGALDAQLVAVTNGLTSEITNRLAGDAVVASADTLGNIKIGSSLSIASGVVDTTATASSATPLADSGSGVVGSSANYPHADHQHPLSTPAAHEARHVSGGADPFVGGDLLDATARIGVQNNGVTVGTRRALNLIAGQDITLAGADVSGIGENVGVTIAATRTAWQAGDTAVQTAYQAADTGLQTQITANTTALANAAAPDATLEARADRLENEINANTTELHTARNGYTDVNTRISAVEQQAAVVGEVVTTAPAAFSTSTLPVTSTALFVDTQRIEYPLTTGGQEYNQIASHTGTTLTLAQTVGYSNSAGGGVASGAIVSTVSPSLYALGMTTIPRSGDKALTADMALRAVNAGVAHLEGFDGYDPTGATNCTPAVDAAVTALLAQGGGTVQFPVGVFALNRVHGSGRNILYRGTDSDSTVQATALIPFDPTKPVLQIGNDTASFTDVDGERLTIIPNQALGVVGLRIGGGANNCWFRRVSIARFTQYDLLVQGGAGAVTGQINNVYFDACNIQGSATQTAAVGILNGTTQVGVVTFSNAYIAVNGSGHAAVIDSVAVFVNQVTFQCGTTSGNLNGVQFLHSGGQNPYLKGFANVDSNDSTDVLIEVPDVPSSVVNYLKGQVTVDGLMRYSNGSTIALNTGVAFVGPGAWLQSPTLNYPYAQNGLYWGVGNAQSAANSIVPDSSDNATFKVGGDLTINTGGSSSVTGAFKVLHGQGAALPRLAGSPGAHATGAIFMDNNTGRFTADDGTTFQPFGTRTYTVGTRPASANTGTIICVTDGAAGANFQGWDGTAWRSLG